MLLKKYWNFERFLMSFFKIHTAFFDFSPKSKSKMAIILGYQILNIPHQWFFLLNFGFKLPHSVGVVRLKSLLTVSQTFVE